MDAATGLGGAQFQGNFGTAIGVEEVKGKIERRRAAVVKDKRHRTLSAAEGAKVHHPAVGLPRFPGHLWKPDNGLGGEAWGHDGGTVASSRLRQ